MDQPTDLEKALQGQQGSNTNSNIRIHSGDPMNHSSVAPTAAATGNPPANNSFAPNCSPNASQTNETSSPWSTTYSMPIYSSFGGGGDLVDCSVAGISQVGSPLTGSTSADESSTFMATIPSTFSFVVSNESNNFLPFGRGNLIDGLDNRQSIKSDNSNLFSSNISARVQKSNQGHELDRHRQSSRFDESLGSSRSYSSVLHSQAGYSVRPGRVPMFDSRVAASSSLTTVGDFASRPPSQTPNLVPASLTHYRQAQESHQTNDLSISNLHQQQQQRQQQQQQQQQAYQHPQNQHLIKPVGHSHHKQQKSEDASVSSAAGGGQFASRGRFNASGGANNGTKRRNKMPFFTGTGEDRTNQVKLSLYGNHLPSSGEGTERFSRKVFVGGLPPDIDEEEIKTSFRRFGSLVVDWPHKAESKSYFPPKGYAFLLFNEECSVQALIDTCLQEEDKLYFCVSSPTIKDKPVQIRPWRLSDADFVLDATLALDPRKTVFVGGVPRPLKASELANIMNNLYGGVCYAGIDTDPELKYPKGAGRVAFSNHQSYIAAISARFVQLHHSEIEKRVEVKPYVLDDQFCDECQGARCNNKFAPFFCANITCLRYYCDNCWTSVHSQVGREFHKPLVKEGSDRPRSMPFRWT